MKLKDQLMNEYFWIAMKQIADPGGDPSVFDVSRGGDGSWLRNNFAKPAKRWLPKSGFVFRLRK